MMNTNVPVRAAVVDLTEAAGLADAEKATTQPARDTQPRSEAASLDAERESTRGVLAIALLAILALVIGGCILFVGTGRLDGTVLSQSIFPSLVTLVGTALGFYFGQQSVAARQDSANNGTRTGGSGTPRG